LIRIQCMRSIVKLRGKWRVGRSRRTVLLVIPNGISLALNVRDAIPSISLASGPDAVASSSVSLRFSTKA